MTTLEVNNEDEVIKKVVFLIVNEIAERARDNLIDFNNVDTGYLLNSLEIKETADGYVIRFKADYASEVEFGDPDPRAKFEDIKAWLQRKGRILNEDELNAKAKVITNKIRIEGQIPKLYLTKAIYSVIDKYSK